MQLKIHKVVTPVVLCTNIMVFPDLNIVLIIVVLISKGCCLEGLLYRHECNISLIYMYTCSFFFFLFFLQTLFAGFYSVLQRIRRMLNLFLLNATDLYCYFCRTLPHFYGCYARILRDAYSGANFPLSWSETPASYFFRL